MIKVYHSKKLHISFVDETYPVFPEEYELVAVVDTDDVETAFRCTNHIDYSWWENVNVELVKQSRSTSVGDVIIKEETGEVFVCASYGWDKIGELYKVKPNHS